MQFRLCTGHPACCYHRQNFISWSSCPGTRLKKRAPVAQQSQASNVVTDNAVPEGHRDLHQQLYGQGGAEAHDAAGSRDLYRQGEDEGRALMSVTEFVLSRDAEKPVGVYALYNEQQQLQHVGISRNIVLAIKGHLHEAGPAACAYVRTKVVRNRAMMSRSSLEEEKQAWIAAEKMQLPVDSHALWTDKSSAREVMSTTELADYEDKRMKMEKAMGVKAAADAGGPQSTDARRQQLIDALSKDDWSSVIDQQTQATQEPAPANRPAVTSPFAAAGQTVGSQAAAVVISVEAVDQALEQVRPMLLADGGNVEVLGLEDGLVDLELQGACGSCAASSVTMKNGIERRLQEVFGDQFKGVQQSNKVDASANAASVDAHLNILRPAIQSYGGSVNVLSVSGTTCQLHFTGPPAIAEGIKAAIRDKFPEISRVDILAAA